MFRESSNALVYLSFFESAPCGGSGDGVMIAAEEEQLVFEASRKPGTFHFLESSVAF